MPHPLAAPAVAPLGRWVLQRSGRNAAATLVSWRHAALRQTGIPLPAAEDDPQGLNTWAELPRRLGGEPGNACSGSHGCELGSGSTVWWDPPQLPAGATAQISVEGGLLNQGPGGPLLG